MSVINKVILNPISLESIGLFLVLHDTIKNFSPDKILSEKSEQLL